MTVEHYDPQLDSFRSYYAAYDALRERHQAIVKVLMPALRRARYDHHLSARRFAPHLGVSASYLKQCETGKKIPAPDLFSRWRDLLGV